MSDINFVKGMNLKTVKTQFGEIINGGINLEEIVNNPKKDDKWVNFSIKKSKNSGNWYAEINTY